MHKIEKKCLFGDIFFCNNNVFVYYVKSISLIKLFVPQVQDDPWFDVFDNYPSF